MLQTINYLEFRLLEKNQTELISLVYAYYSMGMYLRTVGPTHTCIVKNITVSNL